MSADHEDPTVATNKLTEQSSEQWQQQQQPQTQCKTTSHSQKSKVQAPPTTIITPTPTHRTLGDLFEVLPPEGHHLRDAGRRVGAGQECGFWGTVGSNKQRQAVVDAVQEKEAQEGNVEPSPLFGLLPKLEHSVLVSTARQHDELASKVTRRLRALGRKTEVAGSQREIAELFPFVLGGCGVELRLRQRFDDAVSQVQLSKLDREVKLEVRVDGDLQGLLLEALGREELCDLVVLCWGHGLQNFVGGVEVLADDGLRSE